MSIRNKFKKITMVAALVLGGMGVSYAAQNVARLGHSFTEAHPRGIAMQYFANELYAATNGEIKVDVYPSSTLGSEQQMLQAIQSNVQQFYMGAVSPLAGRQKELQIFDFPFLFENNEEVYEVLDGPVGQEMLENLGKMRMKGLVWSGGAFRDLANNKHAVNSVPDLKGLKIRVMPTKVAIDSFEAIGTNPVPLSYSEVFTALETGVLDGHEHPVVDMFQNKVYEVEKYLTITHHVYTPVALIVSKKWFDKLTPEQQKIVMEVAEKTRTFQRNEEEKHAKGAIDALQQNGMKVSYLADSDFVKIREMTKPVIDSNTNLIGAKFVKKFTDEIERVRSKAK